MGKLFQYGGTECADIGWRDHVQRITNNSQKLDHKLEGRRGEGPREMTGSSQSLNKSIVSIIYVS